MKKSISTLLFFLSCMGFIYAQGPPPLTVLCASDDWVDSLYIEDSSAVKQSESIHTKRIQRFRDTHPGFGSEGSGGLALTGGTCPTPDYILPIVVHVIHHGSFPDTKLDSTLIFHQIETLNQAYANANNSSGGFDTKIQFCLAKVRPDSTSFNGINYIQDNSLSIHTKNDMKSLVDEIYYPTDKYINIYVVKEIDNGNPSDILAGYASYPYPIFASQEGIVIAHDWFGDYSRDGSPFHTSAEGKVLVHEMGHYLGLYHPWRGGCNITNCKTEGDKCCDVPQMSGDNPNCALPQTSCTVGVNAPQENYMGYAQPSCKKWFTKDQASIMHATLTTGRKSLWQPENVNALGLTCCQMAARFTGGTLVCQGSNGQLIAYDYTGGNYAWEIKDQQGNIKLVKTEKDNTYTFGTGSLSPGKYHVKLTVSVGASVVSFLDSNYLEVIDCSKPAKSYKGQWFFGKHAGLRFYEGGAFRDLTPYKNSLIPQPAINSLEGTVSLSDSTGDLIFYAGTDTTTSNSELQIFNYDHSEIGAGVQVKGNHTASQGMITIPYPGLDSTYILFHQEIINRSTGENKALYTVLQQQSNGQMQRMTDSVNIALKDDMSSTLACLEGISVVPKCGDSTYWVLIPKYTVSSTTGAMHVLEATNSGISYSSLETLSNLDGIYAAITKFSPDGTLFSFEKNIYQFDRQSGDISLFKEDNDTITNEFIYGASFSPDGKLLYRNIARGSSSELELVLVQLDPYADDLAHSKRVVSQTGFATHIQQGPDDKLYIANLEQEYLSVINEPNTRIGEQSGNECDYNEYGIALSVNGQGGLCIAGLPNFRDADFSIDIEANFEAQRENCYSYKFVPNLCCSSSFDWDFGDGNSSTSKSPSHTYNSNGTYTVQLIADNDTIEHTYVVGMDTSRFSIDGPRSYCDNTLRYEYEAIYDSTNTPDFSYTWSAKTSTDLFPDFHRLEAEWNGGDSLFLNITNSVTGCSGEIGIEISEEPAATINDSLYPVAQFICKSASIDTLRSRTDSSTITYTWYERAVGESTWNIVNGVTGSKYKPTNVTESTEYLCTYNYGCTSMESNVVTINYLDAENSINMFTKTPKLAVLGGIGNLEEFDNQVPVTYIWQTKLPFTLDESGWENANPINTQDSMLEISGVNIRPFFSIPSKSDYSEMKDFSIRRIVNFLDCSDTSNIDTIIVGQRKSLKSDTSICYTGPSFSATLGGEFSHDSAFEIQAKWWSRVHPGTVNTSLVLDTTYQSGNVYMSLSGTQPIHRIYNPVLDMIWKSDTTPYSQFGHDNYLFEVWASSGTPTITTQPSNETRLHGQQVQFTVDVVTPYEDKYFQWEVSADGTNFTPLRGKTSRTLTINPVAGCQNQNQYRCVVTNACGSVTSSAATLTVTNFPTPTSADLWLKDSHRDIGEEPNDSVDWDHLTRDVFMSPDIWNRQDDSTGTTPMQAEFKTLSDNYVRVKLRNRSTTDSSEGGRLRIYWTYGATGEIWDTSWLDVEGNQFYNEDSLEYYPMGGEISPTAGIVIPKIAPGDSVILNQGWRPPNPAWYYVDGPGGHTYSTSPVICLYARIEDCSEFPFGMTSPENYGVDITGNTIRNNNIATLNMTVVNDDPNNGMIETGWTGFGRTEMASPDASLTLAPDNPVDLNQWNVYIDLDDVVYDAWEDGGFKGTSYELDVALQRVTVLGLEFILNDILLPEGQAGYVQPIFEAKVDRDSLDEREFVFYLTQYDTSDSNPLGGYAYVLDNTDGQLTRNTKLYKSDPHGTLDVNNEVNTSGYDWKLIPNPASNEFTVVLPTQFSDCIEINVLNSVGQYVTGYSCDNKAESQIVFDSKTYQSGIYYIELIRDGFKETKKLLIVK
jgi:PKD repeat protein